MAQTRILIVDDELVIRESLAGWLKRDGYEVGTAAGGEEALDLLKQKGFDILLLDIQLDGMSGRCFPVSRKNTRISMWS